jgi:hypothetical protein
LSDSNTADVDSSPQRCNKYYIIIGITIIAVAGIIISIYYFSPSYILPQISISGHATFSDTEIMMDGENWRFTPAKLLFEDASTGTVFSTREIAEDGTYSLSVRNGKTYNVIIGFWQGKILHGCDAGQVRIDSKSTDSVLDVQCHPLNDSLNRSDIDLWKY